MTSTERTLAALRGEEYDIHPAMSITSTATIEGMRTSRAFFPGAHTDWQKMSALASVSHDICGFDSVSPYFSILLEAETLGAHVDWNSPYGTPYVMESPIKDLDNFTLPRDFLSQKNPQQLLKALNHLHRKYNGEVAVVGKVIGPWTLLYHLYGTDNCILDSILFPEKLKSVLEQLSAIPIDFARKQIEAGADVIVWADHMTSDLISAEIYRELLYPIHCRAMKELSDYHVPFILHCCGNIEDRFSYFIDAGFQCFHADSRNNLKYLTDTARGKIKIAGCINNPITLSQSSPRRVEDAVKYDLSCGIDIISPECAIPTSVSLSNLKTLVDTTHHYCYGQIPRRVNDRNFPN
jgi:[methyl-Co(III) methanol-specific corrinoid protein]:coenzyme M methyltransferase